MGWQDDAKLTILGEKTPLEKFEGYWIKAKKFSIRALDEIQAATREVQKSMDRKTIFEVVKRIRGNATLEGMSVDQLFGQLSADEIVALSDSTAPAVAKVMEAKIKHGVAWHNFCDGDLDTRSTDKGIESFAHAVMEYSEIASEILGIVEAFNPPLANPTSQMSAMSPSGSTTEPSLTGATSTPTDGNQPA